MERGLLPRDIMNTGLYSTLTASAGRRVNTILILCAERQRDSKIFRLCRQLRFHLLAAVGCFGGAAAATWDFNAGPDVGQARSASAEYSGGCRWKARWRTRLCLTIEGYGTDVSAELIDFHTSACCQRADIDPLWRSELVRSARNNCTSLHLSGDMTCRSAGTGTHPLLHASGRSMHAVAFQRCLAVPN